MGVQAEATRQQAAPWIPRPFRVRRVRRETGDTRTFDAIAIDGVPMGFSPGQFAMVYVPGVGEVPVSISGNPAAPATLTHTVRAVGAVTEALCRLHAGDLIGVRGPYGIGWPVDEAEGMDVVIVAGGIGIAPLRPAVWQILARRERYGRVVLLYGARTPGDLLYRRDLEHWRGRLDLEVGVTVDFARDGWRGNVGVVTTLIPRAPFDASQAVALVCGPEVMMRFTVTELRKRGLPPERTYLSLERNMHCGIAMCGHCQFGPVFVCRDGPVFRGDAVERLMTIREI